MKLLSFLKTKHGIRILSKIHIYSKMMNFFCHLLRQLYTFIITSYKKIVPKFIHMKKFFFGKMDIWSFSKVIMLAHCISFAPFLGFPNMENGHNRFLKSKAKGQVFNPLTWHLCSFCPHPPMMGNLLISC